ncbi:MAG TPA: glutaredoxin domain-containing protein [Dongiaceae bacterium]|nr:glutaredoxin domain-containing protein [Dongiaceae bacterium]
MPRITLFLIWSLLAAVSAASFAGETTKAPDNQTLITPNQPPGAKAPLVVIYTLSTCPHCREAKEYLKNNNIPFINREIDTNEEHMSTLLKIYDSMGVPDKNRGVPLFVIDNRIRIQGFNKEKLQNALKEVTSKPK